MANAATDNFPTNIKMLTHIMDVVLNWIKISEIQNEKFETKKKMPLNEFLKIIRPCKKKICHLFPQEMWACCEFQIYIFYIASLWR